MVLVEFVVSAGEQVRLNDGELYDVRSCMYVPEGVFYSVYSPKHGAKLVERKDFHPLHKVFSACADFDFYPGSLVYCDTLPSKEGRVVACLVINFHSLHAYIVEDSSTGEKLQVLADQLSRKTSISLSELMKRFSGVIPDLHSTLSV